MAESVAPATLRGPFYRLGEHFAVDLPAARVLFTTRRGGVSRGPYASLNLGRLTNDRPDHVVRNREALEGQTGVALGFTHQVHGPEIHELTPATLARSREIHPGALPHADGQFTQSPGLAPAVLTADCLPVAVSGEGAVAMLHAGWKGLQTRVIAAGVAALRAAGARGPLSAAVGPGARPCCYKVGRRFTEPSRTAPPTCTGGPISTLPRSPATTSRRRGCRPSTTSVCAPCAQCRRCSSLIAATMASRGARRGSRG